MSPSAWWWASASTTSPAATRSCRTCWSTCSSAAWTARAKRAWRRACRPWAANGTPSPAPATPPSSSRRRRRTSARCSTCCCRCSATRPWTTPASPPPSRWWSARGGHYSHLERLLDQQDLGREAHEQLAVELGLACAERPQVAHLQREALEALRRDWYAPNNMSLIVVGDLDRLLPAFIERRFGALAPVEVREHGAAHQQRQRRRAPHPASRPGGRERHAALDLPGTGGGGCRLRRLGTARIT